MFVSLSIVKQYWSTSLLQQASEAGSLKVFMTDFFLFARLNLPNVLISVAKKKFSIAILLPLVLMCQKRQMSLPVGYKTATPKTGDWERL